MLTKFLQNQLLCWRIIDKSIIEDFFTLLRIKSFVSLQEQNSKPSDHNLIPAPK